ncbi:(S)-1-Phenylethanol dehydrogenase [Geodia barretti]|uniref:(S)-1-Phenylethanol dehydrogenase n=1 Tax=Geodia barretti TaxID=519541 RepID=A0AA35RZQ9_GEOBA|nr:(S)-1-Phenylethanol dehydrogenase [Geodia barretti]
MHELKGRVAIVTGAASGIGRSVAELFAEEGVAGLTVADIQAPPLRRLVSDLRKRSGGALLISETDVSDPAQVDRMAQATVERFGRIDILVNNAGICPMVPWDRTTPGKLEPDALGQPDQRFPLQQGGVAPHEETEVRPAGPYLLGGSFRGQHHRSCRLRGEQGGRHCPVEIPGQAVCLRRHPLQRHCARKHRHSPCRGLRGGEPAAITSSCRW